METDVNQAVSIIQIIVTALVTLGGGYLVFRNRSKESDNSVEVARINQADDMVIAYGNLQAQLAQAAENMVAPLNLQIAQQQKLLTKQAEEIRQLREYVKQKSNEQELLTKRVQQLESENESLRDRLDRALQREDSLRQRLDRIRKDIDTGELKSGIHKIPKDKDK